MNKAVTIIAVLAIIFLGGILIFSDDQGGGAGSATGSVYVAVTDAAAEMENISEVSLTTDSVSVYNETNGWVEISSNKKTYDLLALDASGESKLWANADIAAGTYNRIKMSIDSVEVTTTDGETNDAQLPASEITIDGVVSVTENATSSILLDVEADNSLHTAEDGSFVFAPFIVMESRTNPSISLGNDNTVTISGGSVTANITTGMNLLGESGVGVQVNPGETIELNADGTIEVDVNTGPGDQSTSSDSAEADVSAGAEADSTTAGTEAGASVEGSVGVE